MRDAFPAGRALPIAPAPPFGTLCVTLPPLLAHAAITATGDVEPADPATWASSTTAYVGNTSAGTVAVDSGSGLASENCYLGNSAGATGLVTVDGNGSTWTNSQDLYVGCSGSGIVTITGGATVNVGSPGSRPSYAAYVGVGAGGTGLIMVDGIGSTLAGTLDMGGYGNGTVSVTGGGSLVTAGAALGERDYSVGTQTTYGTGVVTVAGAGSTWTDTGGISCGGDGSGTVNIRGGAAVATSQYLTLSSAGTINFAPGAEASPWADRSEA